MSLTEYPQKLTRDGKRVLECLQKSLRIAASCIDELTTVQLYVDALEHYIYYFERGVPEVNAKHVNSLVDLINTQIDKVHELEYPPAVMAGAASGLIEGVGTPDAVVNHYVLLLKYIVSRLFNVLLAAGGTNSPLRTERAQGVPRRPRGCSAESV